MIEKFDENYGKFYGIYVFFFLRYGILYEN